MAVSLALAAQLLAVPSAFAGPEDDRVRVLEDRLRALEDRLNQSESVIEAQRAALGEKSPNVGQGSAIDGFFQSVEVNGHIAASYAYNTNRPEVNSGAQTLNQFNQNSNELSLDAIKLELGKKASEPGSAGFQLDLLFGRNASIFNQAANTFDPMSTGDAAADTNVFVQEGYLSYNLNGIELKAGKFETPLGFEVIDTNDNINITHGVLFTFAIPLFHTGLLAGGNLNEQLSWQLGVVNGFNNTRENGDNKGVIGRLGFANGPLTLQYNFYYGTLGEVRTATTTFDGTATNIMLGDDNALTLINDFIFQATPTDSFTTWVNIDYGKTDRSRESAGNFTDVGVDPRFYGVSAGVKQKITDSLYVALRGEYFRDRKSSRLGPLFNAAAPDFRDIDVTTATLTFGYQISPSLLGRFELRRDKVDCDNPTCAVFRDSSGGGNRQADFGTVELVYSFD